MSNVLCPHCGSSCTNRIDWVNNHPFFENWTCWVCDRFFILDGESLKEEILSRRKLMVEDNAKGDRLRETVKKAEERYKTCEDPKKRGFLKMGWRQALMNLDEYEFSVGISKGIENREHPTLGYITFYYVSVMELIRHIRAKRIVEVGVLKAKCFKKAAKYIDDFDFWVGIDPFLQYRCHSHSFDASPLKNKLDSTYAVSQEEWDKRR